MVPGADRPVAGVATVSGVLAARRAECSLADGSAGFDTVAPVRAECRGAQLQAGVGAVHAGCALSHHLLLPR